MFRSVTVSVFVSLLSAPVFWEVGFVLHKMFPIYVI